MKNLFLERSYKKCGGEPRPRPFHKKSKLRFAWINSLKCYTVFFIVYPSQGLPEYIKIKRATYFIKSVSKK